MSSKSIVPGPKPKGFAVMSLAKRREIASLGGQAAHKSGTAHQFTSEEAKAAAAKSVLVKRAKSRVG